VTSTSCIFSPPRFPSSRDGLSQTIESPDTRRRMSISEGITWSRQSPSST
jgi:hypothetical protein